jgi:tetratricopeptide (TPR) repeat protein
MPRQSTEDIAHEQVTDHRIQRVPDDNTSAAAQKSKELTTIDNLPAGSREYGLAYAQMALHGDSFAQAQGLRFLQAAEDSFDGKTLDPELHTQLGFLEQTNGDKARAIREYQAALQDDPSNNIAAGNLAILRIQAGDTAEAVRLWESVFGRDPSQLAAGYDLAVTQCALGDAEASQKTLNRLLIFSPDNSRARQFSQAIATGDRHCGNAR